MRSVGLFAFVFFVLYLFGISFSFLYRRFPVKRTLPSGVNLYCQDILTTALYSPDASCGLLSLSHVDLYQLRRLPVWDQVFFAYLHRSSPHGLLGS